ncbi:regulatory protein, ArsR [Acidilobus saccharovorans 345-15]|uniref:Regulatory protein, ArsR n=1 Tax=Acidilobus saccharovorans (strain DSM 16705 / JCM 18335 / VKM B-2471 / 345-15) TaxID=666510 RepID=D9PZ28_ACIS3|nr:helix-turn-helix domain-containing protein [Acidilobus saccharovorans]ADL19815.1 regulatory protein, ArsR [Acidilobus saccharovorans 345-15]
MSEDVFDALSHPTRRAIIRALGDRGHLTFTELMDAAGVKDTGTMTFHLRRLSQLIARNSSGEYELTELGRRAYEAIKVVEQKGQEQANVRAEARGGEEGLLVISNRLHVDITRSLLEDARAQGKRVLVSDCISVSVTDDVDEALVREALEGIRDVVSVEAPKWLAGVLEPRLSDVVVVSYRDHVKGHGGAYALGLGWLDRLLGKAVGNAVGAALGEAAGKGSEVYSTSIGPVRAVRVNLKRSSLRLEQGEGKVTVYPYWRGCKHDVSVKDEELIISSDGCYVEVSLPPGASSLALEAEKGDIKLAYGGLSSFEADMLESSLSASLRDLGRMTAELDLSDSEANLELSYGELRGGPG